ncbi:ribonuclease HI family protein [Thermodesulfitimonas sp.]
MRSRTRYFINIDGASRGNPGPAAAAMILQDASGRVLLTKSKPLGVTTNNVAEWLALEGAVKTLVHLTQKNGPVEAVIRSDSELVVKQFNGHFRIKDPELKAIAARVKEILGACPALKVSVTHIPREENRLADRAANAALDALEAPPRTGQNPPTGR